MNTRTVIEETFGRYKPVWRRVFHGGDCVVLRTRSDKYRNSHFRVTGLVRDDYEMGGEFRSCPPSTAGAQAAPHLRSRRKITVIDTDVPGGMRAGFVAVIEIVKPLIEDADPLYSAPSPMSVSMRSERNCPKVPFPPGDFTLVLVFQQGRIQFCDALRRRTAVAVLP